MRKTATLIIGLLLGFYSLSAQNLYDIDNVTVIELTFDDPNWDQTMDTHYSNDMDERLLASCVLNGVVYDSVGVKYKGNSTYDPSNPKNPLNIKLDHIIDDQDYEGWYTLKLSNGDRDPSFVREALSYEILRKYMVAPLSNFAKVYINGSYYGLFTSNESINKKFVEEYFYSDANNTLVKGNPEVVINGGSSLEYLGTDSALYYDHYELKSDAGWSELVEFIFDLNNDFENSEEFMDVDRAIWMLAFNNVLVNLDSYTGLFQQNYYLYRDDNERMNAIVWDLNMSFGAFTLMSPGPGGTLSSDDMQELDPLLRLGDSAFPLVNEILSDERYRKMYIAHCRTMLEENFVNDLYAERAQAMQDIIYDDYDSDPAQIFTTSEFTSNLNSTIPGAGGPGGGSFIGLTELMDARTTYLQSHSDFQEVPPSISTFELASVAPNTSVDITVEVTNTDQVFLGHRNSLSAPFSKVEMYDDGAHNDGAAADGIYGVSIDVGASDVQYYFYAENEGAGMFSPQRAEHEFYALPVTGDVVINEFLASNSTAQADQDGEYDDWVELYNNTSMSIDLSGYYLSDDQNDPEKWTFPAGTIIGANDYLIVWADEDTTQMGLHANFKLSASGEELYLTNSDGSLKDEVIFPAQSTDVSYGRYPNGVGAFTSMPVTFSAENSLDPITGIDEYDQMMNLTLFPNPAKDHFVVNFNSDQKILIEVYNATGINIWRGFVVSGSDINTTSWSQGMYLVKVGNRELRKVIKQ